MERSACRLQRDAFAVTRIVLGSEDLTWIRSCSADAMILGTRQALPEGLVDLQVYKSMLDLSNPRLNRML